ncbi:MAG: hypothetical protein M3438_07875 [Pseudomonadota bacterium]|nr:hypothetical protein [Sphingomonas sp.]MDQ3479057.1 hypothetical protein [Pseudomonadota bacterium]
MARDEDVTRFIESSFPSVWSLEVLLLLRREQRGCTRDELVEALRASDLVIDQALASLVAGGLAALDDGGLAMYMPASKEISLLVDKTEDLYAKRPDAVRRTIISGSMSGLTAFVDAFRLRKD